MSRPAWLFMWALIGGLEMTSTISAAHAAPGPLQGQWAGDQLRLTIDLKGARLELDCASGSINGPIALSSNGTFAVSGTFEAHRAGPQAVDAVAASGKASYVGEVHDGAMKLSILLEGARTPQVFNLRAGARIQLVRCL